MRSFVQGANLEGTCICKSVKQRSESTFKYSRKGEVEEHEQHVQSSRTRGLLYLNFPCRGWCSAEGQHTALCANMYENCETISSVSEPPGTSCVCLSSVFDQKQNYQCTGLVYRSASILHWVQPDPRSCWPFQVAEDPGHWGKPIRDKNF